MSEPITEFHGFDASDGDIAKMLVKDLQRELEKRGLSITGKKAILQERLRTALRLNRLSTVPSLVVDEN